MKKVNLMFSALIAVLVMFSACTPEEAVGPSLILDNAGGAINADTEVEPSASLLFKWQATKGDAKMTEFSISRDGSFLEGWNEIKIPSASSDIYNSEATLIAPANEGQYTYKLTVTDNSDLKAERSVKITVKKAAAATTPLGAEQNATWQRVGSTAATGLSTFGLKWTSNDPPKAIITKDGASKLVKLADGDWTAITTKEGLKEKVDAGTDLANYDGVDVNLASKTNYTDVIATKYNDKYYMIKIVSSTVTTGGSGTTITVQIKAKE